MGVACGEERPEDVLVMAKCAKMRGRCYDHDGDSTCRKDDDQIHWLERCSNRLAMICEV